MTLFDVLLSTARKVGEVFEGTATGGAVGKTTLIDTNQVGSIDDYYNGGTMFFRSGTSLVGKTAVITDYTNTDRTWTFAAQTVAITAGILYSAVRPTYSREKLAGAVNQALVEMGHVTQYDDTTLVTADTEEYTLPAGVSGVLRVEVGASATEPFGWKTNHYWHENGGVLIFPNSKKPSAVGMPLRVWYIGQHAAVVADSDAISAYIPMERLTWSAACFAAEERMRSYGKDDKRAEEWLKSTGYPRRNEAINRFPIRNMARDPILSGYSR